MRKELIILLLLCCIIVSGCSLLQQKKEPPRQEGDRLPQPPESELNLRETILYLPEENWQVLIPVRVYLPWEEGIAKATLRYCTEGNLPTAVAALGFQPLLPLDTNVLGISLHNGLARIDFSKDFLNYPRENERLVLNGLIYTLTEFASINAIELLVENQKAALPGDTATDNPFSREFGLNLEVSANVDDFAETERITLYFCYQAGERIFYVPVTRVVKKTEELLQTVAEELLAGPLSNMPLFSALPPAIKIHSVNSAEGKVSLHLAGDMMVKDQLAADCLRHQIALTFTELEGISTVELLVNGKEPAMNSEINFPSSFGRPKRWNLVE
ncbi:MAG: GerMN domain-containing protein [Firmicutes bacterium]|nr:GerMN domain-containing protein [Bacillota bacterium]